MEALLPLKIAGDWSDHDLQRAQMLILSLDHFWKGSTPLLLHIVVKPNELDVISSHLSATNILIEYINELQLVPELEHFPHVSGWYKQQVIKLMGHKVSKSPYYLILDSDLVCCKAFDENTFFFDGRGAVDWEPREAHTDWWSGTESILGVSIDKTGLGLKPTPVILASEISRQLQAFLDGKYPEGAATKLLSQLGWSEFTLYNAFAELSGSMRTAHLLNHEMQAKKIEVRAWQCFSTREGFRRWTPETAFAEMNWGFFMVCNSSARVAPAEIWEKLKSFFPRSPWEG